ncbi:MAG: class I SAM-dependent methyltransferase [Caldilineaceae bacterium]|nr:class I SAM-dependent methyltransferase [Caldilineaceae bacterium]
MSLVENLQLDAVNVNKTSYDDVLYAGHSYIHSHPNTLSTIARLRGLKSAPLQNCRVLELGCASGENLIPMAEHLPDAEFVGIDLSVRQIERGHTYIERTGVKNVDLRQMDILDVDESLGDFDYILAHGIYSWVPPLVRDQLLAVCRERLRPQGVAYVSYNTFPGWHFFQIARNMMLYRIRNLVDPRERAKIARQFIEQMADFVKPENGDFSVFPNLYRGFIQTYHSFLTQSALRQDAHFLHDELEEFNDPVYFHQFAAHAANHDLQYLGDANFSSMMAFNLPRDAAQMLQSIAADRIEMEQYLDFLRNRSFRHTLLCHRSAQLSHQINMDDLGDFYVASNFKVDDDADLLDSSVVKFSDGGAASIATNHPVSKVAFDVIRRSWPTFYQINELLSFAYASMRELSDNAFHPDALSAEQRKVDRKVLTTNLLKAYATSDNLLRLFYERPRMVSTISEFPQASEWTRLQARYSEVVTNSFHYRVQLDPLTRFLLIRLDGTRRLIDLLQEVMDGPMADDLWSVEPSSENPSEMDAETRLTIVSAGINDRMNWICQSALLVA